MHVLSCVSLLHQDHFATSTDFSKISYLSIQRRPLEFQKKAVGIFGSTPQLAFRKLTAPKIFVNFPSRVESFLNFPSRVESFPSRVESRNLGVSQIAIKGSYSVENLLVTASVKRNSTADVLSGIFHNFKTSKSGGCNLEACNLPQRNSITKLFLGIFQNFRLVRSSLFVEL